MKKFVALILSLALVVALFTGCNVKTKDDVKGNDTTSGDTGNGGSGDQELIPITLMSRSSLEMETNVVRDQLKKAGCEVTLSIQPDYGSIFTQVEARNYYSYVGNMQDLPDNPDDGCRSMFETTGIDNDSQVNDPEVD